VYNLEKQVPEQDNELVGLTVIRKQMPPAFKVILNAGIGIVTFFS